MSQNSPQQVAAQRLEKALALTIRKLFPNEPALRIRSSLELVNNRRTEVEPKFPQPEGSHLKAAVEAVRAFEEHIHPVCREGAEEVLLGDRALVGDRRDVILRYRNGKELSFDVKGFPGKPEGLVDVTSPRSKALFRAVGEPGSYETVRERAAQRDLLLRSMQGGRLSNVLKTIMGEYDYWIVDFGKKQIYPWGPVWLEHAWTANESEIEFCGEMYPSIHLYCQAHEAHVDICPRRKQGGNNLKWHTTCPGIIIKPSVKLEESPEEDLF